MPKLPLPSTFISVKSRMSTRFATSPCGATADGGDDGVRGVDTVGRFGLAGGCSGDGALTAACAHRNSIQHTTALARWEAQARTLTRGAGGLASTKPVGTTCGSGEGEGTGRGQGGQSARLPQEMGAQGTTDAQRPPTLAWSRRNSWNSVHLHTCSFVASCGGRSARRGHFRRPTGTHETPAAGQASETYLPEPRLQLLPPRVQERGRLVPQQLLWRAQGDSRHAALQLKPRADTQPITQAHTRKPAADGAQGSRTWSESVLNWLYRR